MIPLKVIEKLLNEQLMYQEKIHNNIVFVNRQKNFAEVHGTNSFTKSFHGVLRGSDSKSFWWFKTNHIDSNFKRIFICESAIDAMSLYSIHQTEKILRSDLYCSIAGVANQQKIDVLKNYAGEKIKIFLAVDNDEAGERCRLRNKDCEYVIPKFKDWNEDWKNFLN